MHRGEVTELQATIAIAVHVKDKDNKPVNQRHVADMGSSDISGYRLMGKQSQTPTQ